MLNLYKICLAELRGLSNPNSPKVSYSVSNIHAKFQHVDWLRARRFFPNRAESFCLYIITKKSSDFSHVM